MLTLNVYGDELFDEEKQTFSKPLLFTLEFEHSLVSLSKWEEKWEIPFLGTKKEHEKSTGQVLDYVNFMLLTPNPPPDWISKLSQENLDAITDYFDKKSTAAWFSQQPEAKDGTTITADIIYYWLDTAGINWEAQYWHINRLFALIRTHGTKNSKPKPMGRHEAAAHRRAENRRRLKEGG